MFTLSPGINFDALIELHNCELLEKNEKKMRQQLVAISRPGETQRASPTNTIQTLTKKVHTDPQSRMYKQM